MIDVKEIGKTIIVERERVSLDNELRKDIRLMQDAYATLREMPDYLCPIVLGELNTQEIDRLTAQRVGRVEADDSLLNSEKEQRIKVYKNLHRAVATQINTIKRILDKWPDALFEYSETLQNIVPTSDLQKIVEQRCERQVPELCKQHARLVANVFQSIAKLREFEKSEGVSKLRLENLYNLSSQRFVEVWADGSIMQPVLDVSDEFSRSTFYRRQAQENLYL